MDHWFSEVLKIACGVALGLTVQPDSMFMAYLVNRGDSTDGSSEQVHQHDGFQTVCAANALVEQLQVQRHTASLKDR